MITISLCVQRLAIEEGVLLHLYRCPAGKLTIGIGRNVEDNPLTSEEEKVCGDYKHGITRNAAFYLCSNDVKKVFEKLDNEFPWWRELSDNRQWVLVSMCFQLGILGLKRFKKMLIALREGDYVKASAECLDSNFARQCPKRAKRNADCLRYGTWER